MLYYMKKQLFYIQFFNKKGLKPLHIFRMCDNIIKANFKVQTQGVFFIMPNIKSAKKRVLVSDKKRLENKMVRSQMNTAVKKLAENNVELAESLLPKTSSMIDNAAVKGVIHKNAANHKKAQIGKALHQLKQGIIVVKADAKTLKQAEQRAAAARKAAEEEALKQERSAARKAKEEAAAAKKAPAKAPAKKASAKKTADEAAAPKTKKSSSKAKEEATAENGAASATEETPAKPKRTTKKAPASVEDVKPE